MPSAEAYCILTTLILGPLVILASLSFSSLHATEWGLKFNSITMTVDNTPFDAGLHAIGPGSSFIRFPNTFQNVQFSTGDHDLLHTRTSDGLPLTLGVSFQYTLQREHLYDLYMNFKDQYQQVLFNAASHIIADTACNYTAYNFFNDKQSIGLVMQRNLQDYMKVHLYLNVETLQIILFELPKEFEDAILESISVKQDIVKTEKQKQTQIVTFQTAIMAAHQRANQTVTEASGQAQKILAEKTAGATALMQNVNAERVAYGKIQEALQLDADALIEYVWWDSLGEQQANSEILVGLNPSTYIQGRA